MKAKAGHFGGILKPEEASLQEDNQYHLTCFIISITSSFLRLYWEYLQLNLTHISPVLPLLDVNCANQWMAASRKA